MTISTDTNDTYTIAALYHFADMGSGQVRMDNLRDAIFGFLTANHIRGTIILAEEGINGTVAGQDQAVASFLEFLRSDPLFRGGLTPLESKLSYAKSQPFSRMRVRIKPEIVTMRVDGISPHKFVGDYIKPEDWNDFIDDPDVVLVDTRNDFEVEIGTFRAADGRAALDPDTVSFSEFPEYVRSKLGDMRGKKIAMYCTGGIRCEKATSYLREHGFDQVYHLKGGILNYLEKVPSADTRWEGDCFVFDDRVTVGHDLKPGKYRLCYACRRPLTQEQLNHENYERGVSCHKCFGTLGEEVLVGLRERQRQVELAESRGIRHIGMQDSE